MTIGLGVFLFGGVVPVEASLSFGSGYYTNLCDSGTTANYYTCDPGCNPNTGSCQSGNSGVVKWMCSGKWDQCLSSESGWDNYEDFSGVACGTTVQLSLFDKKCRRDDGSWDNSCKLLGYMVWYSGDCTPGFVKNPIPTRTVTPTVKALAVVEPTVKPTVKPTVEPTVASKFGLRTTSTPIPTRAPGQSLCGKVCQTSADCQAGFVCNPSGMCRNPACVDDAGCFCGQVAGAISSQSPNTGESSWWGAVGLLIVGIGGLQMRKLAKKVW
jgi:hypothetical protein